MLSAFVKNDQQSIPWRPSSFAEKIWIKDFGEADGYVMQLVKFDPGAIFPRHLHTKAEFIYILDGTLIQDNLELTKGFVSIAHPGTEDMEVRTEHGCTFNAIGIPIAAGVLYPAFGLLLNPIVAALAMSLSSVSVIVNALRLRTLKL